MEEFFYLFNNSSQNISNNVRKWSKFNTLPESLHIYWKGDCKLGCVYIQYRDYPSVSKPFNVTFWPNTQSNQKINWMSKKYLLSVIFMYNGSAKYIAFCHLRKRYCFFFSQFYWSTLLVVAIEFSMVILRFFNTVVNVNICPYAKIKLHYSVMICQQSWIKF